MTSLFLQPRFPVRHHYDLRLIFLAVGVDEEASVGSDVVGAARAEISASKAAVSFVPIIGVWARKP